MAVKCAKCDSENTDTAKFCGECAAPLQPIEDIGVTKTIEIPFSVAGPIQDPWGGTRVGFEGSTTINRQDFGVKWNKQMDNGGVIVSDEVVLNLHAELIQEK